MPLLSAYANVCIQNCRLPPASAAGTARPAWRHQRIIPSCWTLTQTMLARPAPLWLQ